MDFDFSGKSGLKVGATKSTVKLLKAHDNEIEFEVSGDEFRIDVTGFDPNRDLLVKLQMDTMEGE